MTTLLSLPDHTIIVARGNRQTGTAQANRRLSEVITRCQTPC